MIVLLNILAAYMSVEYIRDYSSPIAFLLILASALLSFFKYSFKVCFFFFILLCLLFGWGVNFIFLFSFCVVMVHYKNQEVFKLIINMFTGVFIVWVFLNFMNIEEFNGHFAVITLLHGLIYLVIHRKNITNNLLMLYPLLWFILGGLFVFLAKRLFILN